MVGTFLSYNGKMILAPGGGFYDDPACCCDACCCPAIAAAYAALGSLSVTVTGDITGTGTIDFEGTDDGYCAQFRGIISMDADGDCDGGVVQIEVVLRCVIGVGGVAGIEVDINGSTATCSVSGGVVDAVASTCDPLSIVVTGDITEILPVCACDGGTFTITITL